MPATSTEGKVIYRTTFKKGNMLQEMHFSGSANFNEAVEKVKAFLNSNHLRHIHTVPFLTDLDYVHANGAYGSDEIDINK